MININYILIAFIILTVLISTIIISYIYYYVLSLKNKYSEYRVFVINLARRRERMSKFGENFHLPIKYEIIDAVDGLQLNPEQLYNNGVLGIDGLQSIERTKTGLPKENHYDIATVGAIGCTLSHYKIWDKIVKENIKYALIFEDDAWVINVNMDDIIKQIEDLPKNWHIYMIGQPHSILEGIPYDNDSHLYKLTRFCGTHAYLINFDGAKWLLEKGMIFPIQQQVDAHLSELGYLHGLNIYMNLHVHHISPFPNNTTDIQTYNSDKTSWNRYSLGNKQ